MDTKDIHEISGWELRAIPAYATALFFVRYLPSNGPLEPRDFGYALNVEQLLRLRSDVDASVGLRANLRRA